MIDLEDVLAAAKRALAARKALERASDARRALPPGTPRGRVTTANARHARAAEAYDTAYADLGAMAWKMTRGELHYHGPDRRPGGAQ